MSRDWQPLGVEMAANITLTGDEEVSFRSGIISPGGTPFFAIVPTWPGSKAPASHLGITVYMQGGPEMTLQFLKGLQDILNDLAKQVERIAREEADPGLRPYIDQLDPADGHADGTD